jgi:hypothetical protein
MKGDVLPVTTAGSLRIPSWVPPPVAQIAREMASDDATPFLTALVQDQRMRRVWHELSKRRRDGSFMHPAAPWWIDPVNEEEERQGVAMAKLLTAAVQFASRPGATSTRRKIERIRKHHLEMARQLRADALRVDEPDERCRLIAAAETYEELAKSVEGPQHGGAHEAGPAGRGKYYWPWPMIFDRDRGDPADRWLACAISYTCRALFCSPMYGITAIIMSVVLGREISPRAVRQMVQRPHPAGKTEKIRA